MSKLFASLLYRPLSPDHAKADSVEHNKTASYHDRQAALILRIQNEIVSEFERLEAAHQGLKFRRDEWKRSDGYGVTAVVQNGKVFEKGGVNTSIIDGIMTPEAAIQMRARWKEIPPNEPLHFKVAGISLVVHPRNPMAPTMHLNYRRFEVKYQNAKKENVTNAWFAGGADLTPSYIFEDDARHFHAVYKSVLDKINPSLYAQYKRECDEYFTVKHRNENRGIGGIFFDDLEGNPEQTFQMVRACANAAMDAYIPILEKRITMSYTPQQREWQEVRHGRYVEFNIMYDRGTKFGLATPQGRVESILMTLPLTARWEYDYQVKKGSEEEKYLEIFKKPKNWLEGY